MFERITEDEERGQVGIGTLIVFIAMVLVAAIAAGVLINTAGFLQTQSEATGEESTQQVTDRLEVIGVVGEETDDNDDPNALDDFTLTVTKAPGSGDIDLSEVYISAVGPSGSASFTLGSGVPILTDDNDRTQITLADDSNGDGDLSGAIGSGLAGGQQLEITLTAPSGGSTSVQVRAPDNIETGDSVFL
ncbi:flagellin [haloarchaeon 3A1-DGR]|nr:flagellin [haloarchaeon 3A1-DGR]